MKIDLQVCSDDSNLKKELFSHVKDTIQILKEILKSNLYLKMITTWYSKQTGVHMTAYIQKSVSKNKTEKTLLENIEKAIEKNEYLTTDLKKDDKIKIALYFK